MIVCLDFDGVLHDPKSAPPHRRLGLPMSGARDACWDLHRQGHTLLVHTARIQRADDVGWLYDWLRFFDFPGSIRVEPFKPQADVYVDDKSAPARWLTGA